MALSYFSRLAEERIREARNAGIFDNLPGKGKPLELEGEAFVPEDLRMAYRVLKNAHFLPPEVEIRKEIHSLWDLLKTTDGEVQRKALVKDIEQRVIRLDLMRRPSMSGDEVRRYTKKLLGKLYPTLAHMRLPGIRP